jgi:hypothetical protein
MCNYCELPMVRLYEVLNALNKENLMDILRHNPCLVAKVLADGKLSRRVTGWLRSGMQ